MTTRQRIIIGIGLVVSAIFLVLAFRGLRPDDFFATIGRVQLGWVLLGAAVYFVAVLLIAWRWQFFLKGVQQVPLWPLMQKVMIGYMGNNVYPLRAGEALRIWLLQQHHGVPIFRATTTVVVERIFDGIVMLTFILIGVTLGNIQSDVIRAVALVALPVFGMALVVFFTLALFPNRMRQWVVWVTGFLPTRLGGVIQHLSEEVLRGLSALQSPTQLAGAVFASYASWMVEALVYWLVMQAFGLPFGYPTALLVVGTVNLAGLIPASPGQIGVYEFFVSSVLIAVRVPPPLALSYAIVVHIVIWLPVTVAGFLTLVRLGMGWDVVTHAREL